MSKLAKSVVYNLTGQGLLLVLGFVAARFVFKQPGGDALGIIYFALALNILLTNALDMGICETAVREVSSHFRSEPGYIIDLLRSASSITYGTAWTILILLRLDCGFFLALAYAAASMAFLGTAYLMVGEELRNSFHVQLFVWSRRAKNAEVF